MKQIVTWKIIEFIGKWPNWLIHLLSLFLARLMFDVVRYRRTLILDNLRIAFGESISQKRKNEIGRGAWYNLARISFDTMKFANFNPDFIKKIVELDGKEHFYQAKEQGRGILFCSLHMGNWEFMVSSANHELVESPILAKKIQPLWLNDLLIKLRANAGINIFNQDEPMQAMVSILRHLKKNKGIGFIMDQFKHRDRKVPFFNKPTRTNTGLAVIALKTKAPIIPVFCQRLMNNTYKVHISSPIQLPKTSDTEQAIYEITYQVNLALESFIRTCPEQWFWMHKRWR